MVELFDKDIKTENRKSSKGNQLKFERDGVWYKADNMGYEGLAECVISALLTKSSLEKDEYVSYDFETIGYKGNTYRGCKSIDFTDGWKLITLERLFADSFGESLNKLIYRTQSHEDRLKLIVNQTERITGLTGFGAYMNKLLTIDALFLNEDRHTHNIAVLMNDKHEFRLCPVFDNGAGLLSDTKMDYPLERDVFSQINDVKPKTFSTSFEEQLEISEKLYGQNISFHFSQEEVEDICFTENNYTNKEKERVVEVILEMKRRYKYLFK